MKRLKRVAALVLALVFFGAHAAEAQRGIVRRIGDLRHDNEKTGAYRALIIGINEYEDPKIRDLKTAVPDARAVDEVLKKHYGFETRLMLDREATKGALYKVLRDFAAGASADDSLLIYYAGHGELDQDFKGKDDGWWIPADAKFDQKHTYLENVIVQNVIAKTSARHVLLISDSCYAGTLFGDTTKGALPPKIDEPYYLTMFNEQSRWGITSGGKTPVSDSSIDGRHSLFAYQLLKRLCQNPRPYMITLELYMPIAPVIGNNSEQTPLCRPLKGVNDLAGQFVFIRAGADTDGIGACEPFPLFADSGGSQVIIPTPPVKPPEKPKPGSLTVNSDQPGSTVTVNGQTYAGYAPKTFTINNMSRYEVRVTKPGYEPYSARVEMGPGETRILTANLEKISAPVAQVSSEPRPGDIWKERKTDMEFVWVPGGCYQMGSNDGDSDEKPVHEVCVDGFWMGKNEVTVGQWKRFISDSGYKGDGLNYWKCDGMGDPEFSQDDSHPAACISWKEAVAFSKWLSDQSGYEFRLPSEAEWEYACRSGGKDEKYSGGDDADRVAWHSGNSGGKTHPVGTKKANGLGLSDMSGNVWEWCLDVWDSNAYSKHDRNNPIYAGGNSDIYAGGAARVLRGGGWSSEPASVRCANRDNNSPGNRDGYLGFRLLRTP